MAFVHVAAGRSRGRGVSMTPWVDNAVLVGMSLCAGCFSVQGVRGGECASTALIMVATPCTTDSRCMREGADSASSAVAVTAK